MNSNYVNHNRRILNEVAGEQHKKWEKENHRRALKKAKKEAKAMIMRDGKHKGKGYYILNALSDLKVIGHIMSMTPPELG